MPAINLSAFVIHIAHGAFKPGHPLPVFEIVGHGIGYLDGVFQHPVDIHQFLDRAGLAFPAGDDVQEPLVLLKPVLEVVFHLDVAFGVPHHPQFDRLFFGLGQRLIVFQLADNGGDGAGGGLFNGLLDTVLALYQCGGHVTV